MTTRSPTILTVDDDDIVRENLRFFLEDKGFAVVEAQDGESGLKRFSIWKPDLVLLDLRMPKMDGLELLKIIRDREPDVPVIVVSGMGKMDDVVEALRLGAWDYIIKSTHDFTILDHVIEKALERARLIRRDREHRERLEFEVERRTEEVRRQAGALKEANAALKGKNVALHEILSTIESEKKQLERNILRNVDLIFLPMILALKNGLTGVQRERADQVEESVKELTASFTTLLTRRFGGLTPTELRICTLIRRGLASKEIARIENISAGTVNRHRENIRRKLGLTNTETNLVVYLERIDLEKTGTV